jgi:hypothetical protein
MSPHQLQEAVKPSVIRTFNQNKDLVTLRKTNYAGRNPER